MEIFNILSSSVSISVLTQIITLFMFIGLFFYIFKTRKQGLKDFHDITELRRELRALTSAAVGVGERVVKIERVQNGLNRGISKMSLIPTNNESSYERAIHLVKKGADVKDLVNTCGLSQGEADLVNLLHNVHLITASKSKHSNSN